VMSTPEPAPRGMMNRTGRAGQAGCCACADKAANAAIAATAMVVSDRHRLRIRFVVPGGLMWRGDSGPHLVWQIEFHQIDTWQRRQCHSRVTRTVPYTPNACAALQHRFRSEGSPRMLNRLPATCNGAWPQVRTGATDPGRGFGRVVFHVSVRRTDQGRLAVTLTLKWDVIAVCVVFMFVGAVLLGAF
jgi:hypothetical protein